jgi:hypothetical protein
LSSLATTFAVEDVEVDRLIVAGRLLLGKEPAFQAFEQPNQGRLAEGALSDRLVRMIKPEDRAAQADFSE